jgi:hypothetical protein
MAAERGVRGRRCATFNRPSAREHVLSVRAGVTALSHRAIRRGDGAVRVDRRAVGDLAYLEDGLRGATLVGGLVERVDTARPRARRNSHRLLLRASARVPTGAGTGASDQGHEAKHGDNPRIHFQPLSAERFNRPSWHPSWLSICCPRRSDRSTVSAKHNARSPECKCTPEAATASSTGLVRTRSMRRPDIARLKASRHLPRGQGTPALCRRKEYPKCCNCPGRAGRRRQSNGAASCESPWTLESYDAALPLQLRRHGPCSSALRRPVQDRAARSVEHRVSA